MVGKIIDKREVAKGTLQVTFKIDEPFSFIAGQYCFITLPNLLYPDDRGGKRHFSIVNSPNQKGIITIATRIRDSGFKKTLNELPLGNEANLGPIAGAFTLPQDFKRSLVFIAGGIGITPFMSMLRYISEENPPYHITLIYSNRDKGSTAFLEELKLLATKLTNYKLILTMTEDPNWEGEKRRVDVAFIKDYFPDVNSYSYFVVGPPPMVDAVQRALLEAGVDITNIKIENFTGY